MHRSMEPDEMNPWVQREWSGEVVKPLSFIFGIDRPEKYLLFGKEEKIPILKIESLRELQAMLGKTVEQTLLDNYMLHGKSGCAW